jgi:hypothetical protein
VIWLGTGLRYDVTVVHQSMSMAEEQKMKSRCPPYSVG